MGILDGILGPALTVGTQAAAAQQSAQTNAAMLKRSQDIQMAMLARQLRQEQSMEEYHRAMGDAAEARARRYNALTDRGPKENKIFRQAPDGSWFKWDDESSGWQPTQVVAGPHGAVEAGGSSGAAPGAAAPATASALPATGKGARKPPINQPGSSFVGRTPPPPLPYSTGPVVQDPTNPGVEHPTVMDRGTGQVIPQSGLTVPPKVGAGRGASGVLTAQQVASMLAQAREADKVMRDYEQNYGGVGLGSAIAAGASTMRPTGPITAGVKALGNMGLGMADPKYQTYLAARRKFGNVMANLQARRYTEHQGVLDTDLAGIDPKDAKGTIALKQQFRNELLNSPVDSTMLARPTTQPSTSGRGSPTAPAGGSPRGSSGSAPTTGSASNKATGAAPPDTSGENGPFGDLIRNARAKKRVRAPGTPAPTVAPPPPDEEQWPPDEDENAQFEI